MTKKTIATLLIITFVALPIHNARAGYWGENFAANGMKQLLEEISIQVREAINASAKMMAIKQATSMIETLLYGGNSSQRNISNFEEFLITDPQDKSITYAQDFLTNATRGTTSGDYTSASGGGALSSAITDAGNAVIDGLEGKNAQTVDYAEYCNGDDYFADGNFQCFSAIMSNPLNTPIGMALAVDQVAAAKYQQEKEVAMLYGTSTGVLPQVDEKGNVVLPSSVVEAIQLQQITLPLEALANGDSGVFSSFIQSFAVGLIVGVVERGLGEVEQSIDQNVDAFERQYTAEMGDLYDKAGPAAQYTKDSYDYVKKSEQSSKNQEAAPWVNPDTNINQTEDPQSTPGGSGGV